MCYIKLDLDFSLSNQLKKHFNIATKLKLKSMHKT